MIISFLFSFVFVNNKENSLKSNSPRYSIIYCIYCVVVISLIKLTMNSDIYDKIRHLYYLYVVHISTEPSVLPSNMISLFFFFTSLTCCCFYLV